MLWLNKVVDEVEAAHPKGEIIVSSGVSPSGTYHVGTLREVLTADAIRFELNRRGRISRHIHVVDDLDVFRKVPANVPADFKQYLGRPLSDIPAPDGPKQSYADYFLNDFLKATKLLHIEMDVMRSHERYRNGSMVPAIEKALAGAGNIRKILETVSGHKLEDNWSPVQVMEEGYLKTRRLVSVDTTTKTITYLDVDNKQQTISYSKGDVKLNWRVDWPARWWLLKVAVEPFGRDHASRGGSYDTGAAISRQLFGAEPPLPVPYQFINTAGETKKMSKSEGNIIASSELVEVLPPEVIRFFILGQPPPKQLFFDSVGVSKLVDDFAELLAKKKKTDDESQVVELCTAGVESVVSRVPFSHLVASYQAALGDKDKTLDLIARTEHKEIVQSEREVIKKEMNFIERWLKNWAPDEVKFQLLDSVDSKKFSQSEKDFLSALAEKIAQAPPNADGEWFHKAIYQIKESANLSPEQVFKPLYRALIGKESGPRAGWFLSILPRDWLVKRLKLNDNER